MPPTAAEAVRNDRAITYELVNELKNRCFAAAAPIAVGDEMSAGLYHLGFRLSEQLDACDFGVWQGQEADVRGLVWLAELALAAFARWQEERRPIARCTYCARRGTEERSGRTFCSHCGAERL